MSTVRNLVVLADGTGNSAAKPFKTNVWRLYQALDLADGSQLAVFGDGVGTSSFKPLQLLGLALGVGVKRNVLNLYKFLCRNYNDGDRVWAFGFSRGAFTVRVLAGLIHHEGLLSFRSEAELNRNAIAAYRAYRTKAFKTQLPWVKWGRAARDLIIAGWNRAVGARTYKDIKAETFERGRHLIDVHFIGVWDTVAAYGLPVDELTQAVDKWVWPMSFRDTSLLTNVDNARHALSLDDERRSFFPIPWNEADERKLRAEDPEIAADRLLQVWFAGVHASVGGGYADDAMAHIPLCWMIEEAQKKGLRFKPWAVQSYVALASPTGRIYDSRAGTGAFYRYQPRDVQMLMGNGIRPQIHYSVVTRMAHGNDGYAPISIPHDLDVLAPYGAPVTFNASASASKRAQLQPPPANLLVLPGRDPTYPSVEMDALLRNIDQLTKANGSQDRAPLISLVQDTVWWRRLVYFVSLFLALTAVAYPVIYDILRVPGLTERVNAAAGGVVDWATGLIKGFLPGFVGPWLVAVVENPAVAAFVLSALVLSLGISALLQRRICDRARAAWQVQAEADGMLLNRLRLAGQRRSAARTVVVFGILLLGSFWLGSDIRLLVFFGLVTAASAVFFVWRARHPEGDIDAAKPGFLLALARNLRTSPGAVAAYRWVARSVVPALFLAICVVGIVTLATRATFDGMNAVGHFCKGSQQRTEAAVLQEKIGAGALFPTNAVCHPTGLTLVEGRRYRITITMQDDWFDKGIRTDVAGFTAESFRHYTAAPMKRWWGQKWFQPIARIGELGNYEYALEPSAPLPAVDFKQCRPTDNRNLSVWETLKDTPNPVSAEQRAQQLACEKDKQLRPSRVLISDIRAGSTGELFVYVNDAVLMWPGLVNVFYRNNSGTAAVEVSRIRAEAIIKDE
jgi:uncharacterized protein (DUF2235 family)